MTDLGTTIRRIQRLVGVKQDGVFGPVTAVAVLQALDDDGAESPASGSFEWVFDARTKRNLATLDPKAQVVFVPFIARAKAVAAAMGCDYVAISGNRTWAEQDALYAQGRTKPGAIVTNAKGGYSNHNFGIALDFGVFRGGRYLDETDPEAADRVHSAASGYAAPRIVWGGDWAGGLKDFPHYEVFTGLSMTEKRARYKQRGSVL